MKKILVKINSGILSGICIVVILYLTLAPKPLPDMDLGVDYSDKIAHLLLFFIATCVFYFDYIKSRYPRHPRLDVVVAITLSSVIFGGLIELLQELMGMGRHQDIYDFVFNSIGAVLAFIISELFLLKYGRTLIKSVRK